MLIVPTRATSWLDERRFRGMLASSLFATLVAFGAAVMAMATSASRSQDDVRIGAAAYADATVVPLTADVVRASATPSLAHRRTAFAASSVLAHAAPRGALGDPASRKLVAAVSATRATSIARGYDATAPPRHSLI